MVIVFKQKKKKKTILPPKNYVLLEKLKLNFFLQL